MVGDPRQGWAILAAMLVIFVPLAIGAVVGGTGGRAGLASESASIRRPSRIQPGGNMEGKETRFGIVNSALWALRHDGRLERQRQLDARLVHAARRTGPDVADATGRSRLRRRRAAACTAC